jgi:DNA end-binding protein Ku
MASTVWRGRLAFGMVAIPVRLYKAARRERMKFHRVYRPSARDRQPEPLAEFDDEPEEPVAPVRSSLKAMPQSNVHEMPSPLPLERVRNMPVQEFDDVPVRAPETLRGYEVEKNRYVVVEPKEVQALRPATSTELDILEFVHLAEIDPIYFDASYYVAPDPGGEKAYALLFQAMREAGYVALGSLAMHGREHSVVVRAGENGLILHTLFYANEVRSGEEYRSSEAVQPKELDLAKQVVRSMAAEFDAARLKDAFEERLRALVESRVAEPVAAKTQREAASAAPVVDIMEALKRSLQMAKKPAQRETAALKKKTAGKRSGAR